MALGLIISTFITSDLTLTTISFRGFPTPVLAGQLSVLTVLLQLFTERLHNHVITSSESHTLNYNVCRSSPLHAHSNRSRDLHAGTKRQEKYMNREPSNNSIPSMLSLDTNIAIFFEIFRSF